MRPSRIRWLIAALLLLITSLTYLDRLNMMVAAARIRSEFGLTDVQIGTLLSAFVLGYALFQIPGGLLVDVVGPKRLLGLAMLWWSLFTVMTALADKLPLVGWFSVGWSFIVVRFLVGMGEAPALPAANKIVGLWMAPEERALGNGIFIAGLGLGGAVAPPLVVWVMETWGWRTSFWATGALGLPLLLAWLLLATDRPEDHRHVNLAELVWIRRGIAPAQGHAANDENLGAHASSLPNREQTEAGKMPALPGISEGAVAADPPAHSTSVPWRAILSHSSVWALVGSYFLAGYTGYVFFTWSFLYIVNVRKLSVAQAGLWTMTPFLAMAVLSPVGGYVSDWAVRRWGRQWGRRFSALLGMGLAALFLLTGSVVTHAQLAIGLIALAAGFTGFALVNWWATTVDITRRFAGSVAGLMNTAGNLGGVVSPTLTPYLAERFGWVAALGAAAAAALLSGLIWFFVHPDRPLQDD